LPTRFRGVGGAWVGGVGWQARRQCLELPSLQPGETMGRRWRFLGALALLCGAAQCYDVEGGGGPKPGLRPPAPGAGPPLGQPPSAQGPRSAISGINSAKAEMSKWYRAYQGFIAGAAKVNQIISFLCGIWLVFSWPLTMVGACITLQLADAAMISLLAMYGVLLAGVEVPLGAVQRILRQYFFFVYTRMGRGLFVFQVAVLAYVTKQVCYASLHSFFPFSRLAYAVARTVHEGLARTLTQRMCTRLPHARAVSCNRRAPPAQVGMMTKMLMLFNAGLSFYILNQQDRRFAQVDAQAAAAMQQASEEMRGSVSEALSFTKMFSGALGGRFGGRGRPSAREQQPSSFSAPDNGDRGGGNTPTAGGFESSAPQQGGGFQSRQPEGDDGEQGAWPWSGGEGQ
jgi:hypothetical protein